MKKYILIILFFFAVRVQSAEQIENISVKGSVTSPPVESLVDFPCIEECEENYTYQHFKNLVIKLH
jgi:hypothetical protein